MSWTTPSDIQDRWLGSGKPVNTTQLQLFIDDIEEDIKAFYPKIQDRINDGDITIGKIVRTVANAIIEFIRAEQSPYSQQTQTTGPYSASVTLASNIRRSPVLTSAEMASLGPTNTDNAFVIDQGYDARTYQTITHVEIW